MMYKPELFVYLWLLPVFVIFIAPFLIIPAAQLREILFAAGNVVRGKAASQANNGKQDYKVDQRKHPRQTVDGFVAHVSDGVNYCKGSVQDVSKQGICFISQEGNLDDKAEKLGVLLTGPGQSFQMQVKPVWHQKKGPEQNIGVIVEDSLGNWQEYTDYLQPPQSGSSA